MTTFARDIQIVCFGTLVFLAVYTLWLSRYRGLDGHLTVRWLLLLGAALLTILFWRYLPFFSVTSNLQERELLLMITVLMFAFVVFLMLDLLVRSSRQSVQIKRLTQELAIQRARVDRLAPGEWSTEAQETVMPKPSSSGGRTPSAGSILACIWIAACLGLYVADIFAYNSPAYPSALRKLLTADYLQ